MRLDRAASAPRKAQTKNSTRSPATGPEQARMKVKLQNSNFIKINHMATGERELQM
jgi:hypothetical protein